MHTVKANSPVKDRNSHAFRQRQQFQSKHAYLNDLRSVKASHSFNARPGWHPQRRDTGLPYGSFLLSTFEYLVLN